MVPDLLGPSLSNFFNFFNRKFSLKTVLLLADQSRAWSTSTATTSLSAVSSRTASPCQRNRLRSDKKYRDPKTHLHSLYRENKNLTGTARYTSINTHLEVARHDGLQSFAYVLMYLLCGRLPWPGLKVAMKMQKYDRIMEKKMTTPTDLLCRGCLNEFGILLNYRRALCFDDNPDCSYLWKSLHGFFVREGYQHDCVFDWSVQRPSNPEDKSNRRKVAGDEEVAEPSPRIGRDQERVFHTQSVCSPPCPPLDISRESRALFRTFCSQAAVATKGGPTSDSSVVRHEEDEYY
ncbi:serine/threonine protein kinase [Ceratobasidium sp. 395]|nr:serine/threonine protein kinase [Ceratobasidium sp. 395]